MPIMAYKALYGLYGTKVFEGQPFFQLISAQPTMVIWGMSSEFPIDWGSYWGDEREGAFPIIAPWLWSDHPLEAYMVSCLLQFKWCIEAELFRRAFEKPLTH